MEHAIGSTRDGWITSWSLCTSPLLILMRTEYRWLFQRCPQTLTPYLTAI